MQWDRDKLLMELSRFTFKGKPNTSDAVKAYRNYYKIDFSARVSGLDQRIGWVDSPDFRIVIQTFKPKRAKATVFVFHGYFDHAGIYGHLVQFLLEQDYAVVVHDMPGHGLSSGQPTSIHSFQQYQDAMDACLEECRTHLPEPFHAVGQSTGGAVLIDRLLMESNQVASFDKVVLLAPLVRPVGWKSITRLHAVVSPFLNVWYRTFSQNSHDQSFVTFLKKNDPLQSKWLAVDWIAALKDWVPRIESGQTVPRKVTIVQGTGDHTVDWKHNLEVLKRLFQEVKLIYIEDGRHHLVNETKDKREAVFNAVRSELSG